MNHHLGLQIREITATQLIRCFIVNFDGQAYFYDGVEVPVRLDGWVVNDGAGSTTANELERIARGFGNLRCEEAKNAMVAHLTKNNIRFEVVRMQFAARAGVVSLTIEGMGFTENISLNGVHWGVAYNNRIHCNIHPAGLSESAWVNDFIGAGGFESITPLRLRSLRRLP